MTKGALEMGNEEYIIQWDDMTPEAKEKKERLEQDPSFRTDHMAYMEGMDQISTDIRDKVMSQVESYDEKVYTAADVQAALAHDVCSIEDFKALLSPAAAPYLEQMARKAEEITKNHFGNTVYISRLFILPITVRITAYTAASTAIIRSAARSSPWKRWSMKCR